MKRKTFENGPFALTCVQVQTGCTYDDFVSFCAQNIPDFNKWNICREMDAKNDVYYNIVRGKQKALYLYEFRSRSIFRVIKQENAFLNLTI